LCAEADRICSSKPRLETLIDDLGSRKL
jgi:hypothetical protein